MIVADYTFGRFECICSHRNCPCAEMCLMFAHEFDKCVKIIQRRGNEVHAVTLPVSSFVATVAADICRQMRIERGDMSGVTIV